MIFLSKHVNEKLKLIKDLIGIEASDAEIIKYITDEPESFVAKILYNSFPSIGIQNNFTGLYSPYKHQCDLLDTIETDRFVLINLARQTGFTSTLMLYAAWTALTKPNSQILLLDTKQSALGHSNLVYFFAKNPLNALADHGRFKIRLKNDSVIHFGTYNQMWRGLTVTHVLSDSVAFSSISYTDMANSLFPCLTHNDPVVVFGSVPARNSGLFYDLWHNPYFAGKQMKQLTWSLDTSFSKTDHITLRNMLGDRQFENEYCNKFII